MSTDPNQLSHDTISQQEERLPGLFSACLLGGIILAAGLAVAIGIARDWRNDRRDLLYRVAVAEAHHLLHHDRPGDASGFVVVTYDAQGLPQPPHRDRPTLTSAIMLQARNDPRSLSTHTWALVYAGDAAEAQFIAVEDADPQGSSWLMTAGILTVALTACLLLWLRRERLRRDYQASIWNALATWLDRDHDEKMPPVSPSVERALLRQAAREEESVADLDLARTERDRFHAVIDSLQEGVVAIDREERILFANEAVRQLIDAGDALLPGRPFWESVRQRDVLQLPVQAMEEEQAVFREVTLHLASGERTIQTSSFPLWMGSEEPNGAVLLLRDTTELRSLETIRRDFVANVSHELKTPLTAIAGLTETIIGDDEMPKSIQNNFIKRIHNQAERLSALVLDLLSLSRIEAYTSDPEAEQFDLMEIVQDCAARLSDLAHKQGHDLLLKRPDQPVPIHGDRESLTQAVDNLISNALRYTPNPGRVEVQVDRDASHGWISVSDNGIGIDRREQERIFERFYRVDKARSRELGGTGLGLSIVKHVVQRHGGTVDLISAPAEGSTFTIRLPVSEGASWLGPSA